MRCSSCWWSLATPSCRSISPCSLRTPTSLQQLDLKSTQATGDIGSLSTMTMLRELDLKSMQMTGDIGSLSALTYLQQLDLK